jgi:hypothetical protein
MISYGMIYTWSFMKIGSGVWAILRFCLRNLTSSNVGITEVKDLWMRQWNGLKFHDKHTKFIRVWHSHSKVNKGIHLDIQTHTERKVISYAYIYFFQNMRTRLKMIEYISSSVCIRTSGLAQFRFNFWNHERVYATGKAPWRRGRLIPRNLLTTQTWKK